MKTLNADKLKKLIKIIYQLKANNLPIECVVFGDGRGLDMVEKGLKKKGIEIK